MDKYPFVTQDRVYLLAAPESQGTVSDVREAGFTVSYDNHERRRNEPRLKFTYPWDSARFFKIGNPPPIRVVLDRETDNG